MTEPDAPAGSRAQMQEPPMARAKPNPPGIGHNAEPLTEAQEEALQTFHEIKWNEIEAEEERAVAMLKAVRKRKGNQAKQITQDLGHTRIRWEDYIADLRLPNHEYLEKEAARSRLRRLGGLDVGAQQELPLGDTVDDQAAAEKAGRRAYRAFKEPVPPAEVATFLHQDWMRGWQDEQRKVIEQMGVAEEVIAARASRPKAGEMAAAPDEDEGEEEGDPEAGIEDEVQRLEQAGWVQPTEDEAKFEESDNGRTIRQSAAA
jgi:flagellar biosynthesis regulator FlaF